EGNVKADFLQDVDAAAGLRAGEAFYLRLGTGTPADSLHSPVHEFMHFISDPMIKGFLGHELNEGLTEIITQEVMGEALSGTGNEVFNLKSPAYAGERAEVQELMSGQSLSKADLIQAYFH